MSDASSVRDLIRDELAGWYIGSGYYATAVSVDDARDMADAVLAVLRDLPADVIERAALALIDRDGFEPDLLREVSRSEYRSDARAAFTAVFGGERDAAVE